MRAWRGISISTGMLLILVCASAALARPEIVRVRHWSAPDHTRIVLDLTGPASYEIRRVDDPHRIAVNIAGARFRGSDAITVQDGLVRRIRRNPGSRRAQVVVDLSRESEFRHFSLPAAAGRPDRIVIDVQRSGVANAAGREMRSPSSSRAEPDVFTVILDPGHGGMDPGAIRKGVEEKDIVLQVAREAARMLDRLPGYRAHLTRDRDYFLSLARRVEIAQEKKGDLFLSIHTNTHARTSIAGMEVYVLSLEGATDNEARELANKENAADLVGLAPEERGNDSVLSILMDLRMTSVLDRSSRLAERMLGVAEHTGVVRARKVKQADFQVLRSLAMPSALVELAYLSNAGDRKLMTEREGVEGLAGILVAGILGYRGDRENLAGLIPGELWTQRYRVRAGDTLWELARRYKTTVTEIRERNRLSNASLLIGQTLTLPALD